jgi:hypothetical protein
MNFKEFIISDSALQADSAVSIRRVSNLLCETNVAISLQVVYARACLLRSGLAQRRIIKQVRVRDSIIHSVELFTFESLKKMWHSSNIWERQ